VVKTCQCIQSTRPVNQPNLASVLWCLVRWVLTLFNFFSVLDKWTLELAAAIAMLNCCYFRGSGSENSSWLILLHLFWKRISRDTWSIFVTDVLPSMSWHWKALTLTLTSGRTSCFYSKLKTFTYLPVSIVCVIQALIGVFQNCCFQSIYSIKPQHRWRGIGCTLGLEFFQ